MKKFHFPSNLIDNASVVTIASFIIVVILAVAFIWPGFEELRLVRKNLEEKRAELQGKEEYLLRIKALKAELEERSEDFSKIKSALPDDPSVPSLFHYLQNLSSQSGLILESISPFAVSPSSDPAGLQETVFSVKVVGSYSSFKNFLYSLERSARLIRTEDMSFSASKDEEGIFVFSLKIKTFSY